MNEKEAIAEMSIWFAAKLACRESKLSLPETTFCSLSSIGELPSEARDFICEAYGQWLAEKGNEVPDAVKLSAFITAASQSPHIEITSRHPVFCLNTKVFVRRRTKSSRDGRQEREYTIPGVICYIYRDLYIVNTSRNPDRPAGRRSHPAIVVAFDSLCDELVLR